MKFFIAFALLLSSYAAQSQQYRYAYYFNEKMQPVSKAEALVIGRGVKTANGVTVDFFAAKTGRKLFTTDFSDSTLNYMNGRNINYDEKGRVMQANYYKNNILDGLTQKWEASGRMTDSIIYREGKMINKTKFSYTKEGLLVNYNFTDSLNDKMYVIYFDSAHTKTSEVLFTGDKGVWNYYRNGIIYKSDSVYSREEKDATFPGGKTAWKNYLERELNASIPVRAGAGPGKYIVTVQFIVDTTGNISDVKALTKNGFGTETEAVRVIKQSGKWIPAKQFGKSVKAYRKQPVIFQVQGSNIVEMPNAVPNRSFRF